MKRMKKIIALVACLCIMISLLPPFQITRAAEVVQRYELDTDGIDPGATYLIVNTGTAGNANALNFNYGNGNSSRGFRNQTMRVQTDENGTRYVATGFTDEADCQFQFSGRESGKITHGDYAVDLANQRYTTSTNPQVLTFDAVGSGAYRIYYSTSSYFYSTTYYLRYNSSTWSRYSRGTANVYLYKLVQYEVEYDIVFDGNGYTAGQLPDNRENLDSGSPYTIPFPAEDLRKDIGMDTWLFLCWNTEPDGSGTEYVPGQTITVTEDLTLYAEWYQQTKYAVSMITELDGVRTDVDEISGQNKSFAIKNRDAEGEYIPLERTEAGTYTTKVAENGDYIVYTHVDDGEYEPAHGHMVTIYNQDGATVCQHFTVSYDTQGGVWAEGQEPGRQFYHALDAVTLTDKTPTLAGNRFLYWKDQNGKIYPAGGQIDSILEKVVLTAVWEETIDITIHVTVDHNSADGGNNNAADRNDVLLQLLRVENDVNLPLDQIELTSENDPDATVTTYTVSLKDQQQGNYHVTSTKSGYQTTVTYEVESNGDQTITVKLQYAPENFDLAFDVKVNAQQGEEPLMPNAVNVKVSCWGRDDNGVLGWHIITQQEGTNAPITVTIDENGEGSGTFSVWHKWPDVNEPYLYRLEVTSYVMPDGRIVATSDSAAGLYQSTLIVQNGKIPTYPGAGSLEGAYFDGTAQAGDLTVKVEINPYTVTFDAKDGKVDGKTQLVLDNQYRYPDLTKYTAVPNNKETVFLGWYDQHGNPANELAGTYLTENVVLTARYGDSITLTGVVEVPTTYEHDGHTVTIHDADLLSEVMVLVRKQIGNQFITLDSQLVAVDYTGGEIFGSAEFTFTKLPNDGTHYQISVLAADYDGLYDCNLDDIFTADDNVVIVDMENASAEGKARLVFNPEIYRVGLKVDASQIAEGFRPTEVLAQLMYRDLGNTLAFNVISQHTVPPYGVQITQDKMGQGLGADDVWIRHVDGTYYEYQIELNKLYGSVEGAYVKEGTAYTEDSPFTVSYGAPSNFLKQDANGEGVLEATLVPKEYPVILDLNIPAEASAPVRGMDEFLVDDGTGNLQYAYIHTWSYAASFDAYPYLEGYVFKGWIENTETADDKELVVDDGNVYVGATLAKTVTLTADWEPLEGTDFTVRHLELNTNKVLHGAQVFTNSVAGRKIVAADHALSISGYEYAGAMLDGIYVHKANNPAMIVSTVPTENLLIIYYLPDSTSGYTEQVESNLFANKTAILEDNGTYTITLDTYTKDSPVTTKIRFDTPLDVVLVLDQSGSMYQNGALNDLKDAVSNFITQLADHGRNNEVDHRVAIVGYASDEDDGYSRTSYPTAGKDGSYFWYNTGVFGVHGDFHPYSYTGFNYTEHTGLVEQTGTYYTEAHGEYLLLTYHEEYRHLITEEEARQALLDNNAVYGYVEGQFVELTRNSSGLWLYGDKQLYTSTKFFTYHTDVWTHREGLERREIHAYGLGSEYREVGEHSGVYTRTATKDANPQKSLYKEALIPVSLGANGSGGVTPGLTVATQKLGANGTTHVSYGMEMANRIFEANPLEEGSDRERIIIVFTDGKPGDGSNFDEAEANRALECAALASDPKGYNAHIYAIGLYGSDVVAAESDQVFFMNGLSSNYPNATSMDDVWVSTTYQPATSGIRIDLGGPYYVQVGGQYYKLTLSSAYENKTFYNCWGYEDANGNRVIISKTPNADGHPMIVNSMVGDYTLYHQYGDGYQEAENTGYYVEANKSTDLKEYFAKIMRDITTNVTTEIILDEDTILRDILNQGLVFTENTVITVSTQLGIYNTANDTIDWAMKDGKPVTTKIVELALNSGYNTAAGSDPATGESSRVRINIFNQDVENDPDHPHTVDITGYNYAAWYISKEHTEGYKMIVEISNIEARDEVQWGRSYTTNHERSGLWLPADENDNRQLLFAFDQPTTIFVERAYVLDYGKEFELTGWYFDDENGNEATPVHLDLDIASGMNAFDTTAPNRKNTVGGAYGNTKYGNVRLDKNTGKVYYSPTTMNWGGYDSFYVFGNTWRQTVKAQDANANGNLWNKVTVIPANNIYYEDSFITKSSENQGNDIEGFVFSGEWGTVYSNGAENAGQNVENPEHLESAPYGDVHGWTDSLGDDQMFTDGSAHSAFPNGYNEETREEGAKAALTFTGTGVEVYSRTNMETGAVIAILSQVTEGENGEQSVTQYRSLMTDNLSMSGDYYHIPTIAFKDLPYGTYLLELFAMASNVSTNTTRYHYYIDGVRVHNPLGNSTSYQSSIIKDAYGLENNAVYTEIRDILLSYGDFNTELPDGTDNKIGAVFIDWIREGQGTGNDVAGTKVPTYQVGTFEKYGPKNEVYLSAGQAVVLKVAEGNTYYIGLKSLNGKTVKADVSGLDMDEPTTIELNHTTDMYYQVTPVGDYIVIKNGSTEDGALLSMTNLRTTNMTRPAANGGVLPVAAKEAVEVVSEFTEYLLEKQNEVQENPQPDEPEEEMLTPEEQAEANQQRAAALFTSVRQWLKTT